MRSFILMTLLMLSAAAAQAGDVIYFEDGTSREVPNGYKILVVPHWTKANLLTQQVPIRVLNLNRSKPEKGAISCTPAGELSNGAPACPAPAEPAPVQKCTPEGELSLGAPPCKDS